MKLLTVHKTNKLTEAKYIYKDKINLKDMHPLFPIPSFWEILIIYGDEITHSS